MYNEYLQDSNATSECPCTPEPTEQTPTSGQYSGGGLMQLLSEHLGASKFNTDTLIAIAVVWFLLSDGKVLDTDLLIVIGVLLLLGL